MLNISFLFARWRQLSAFKMAAYSDINFKQKAVIEFLLKEGMAAGEMSDGLRNVYGEWALSFPTVRRWAAEFKGGRSDIIDKPRSGRPSFAVTEANKQFTG